MVAEKVITIISAKERVAFDLMEKILNEEYTERRKLDRAQILDLYAECLYAATGNRKLPGR